MIPGAIVDAVVEEPFGCHPCFAQGYYDRDNRFYLEWDAIAKDPETLDGLARRVGLRAGEPSRVRREVRRRATGTRCAPSRRCPARSTTGGTRERAGADLGYSKNEIMIAASARLLGGARNCFVGVGLPNIVCNLAQRTVASELQLIYESGVYGARPAAAAVVDRRPDARDGLHLDRVDVRAVRLLPAARARRRGVPGRRADRPVREPEHDGDRRLRPSEGPAAGLGRAPARSRSTRARCS